MKISFEAFESRLMVKLKEKLAEVQQTQKQPCSVKIVSPPPKTTVMLNLQLNAQAQLNKNVQIKETQRCGKHNFQIVIVRQAVNVVEEVAQSQATIKRVQAKKPAKKISEMSSSSESEKSGDSPSDMTSQEPGSSDASKDSSPKPTAKTGETKRKKKVKVLDIVESGNKRAQKDKVKNR